MAGPSLTLKKQRKRNSAPLDALEFFGETAPGRLTSMHAKKAIIFSQGDEADAVFYIRTGKIKISIVSQQGKEAVVAILGPDEFFGEGCLIGQKKRLATASAMTECVTVWLKKTEVARLLHKPAFSEMFLAHILTRNARVDDDLVDPALQFNREAARQAVAALGQFWKRRCAAGRCRQDRSRNAR
jgi:CRP/FNR family cyclic AMP-dependent transcriptional regulator